jgi:hypothetical protein
MGYRHKEAFALMWYACPCGHRERIWNSRDGVTPFGGIACVSCGGNGIGGGLTHVEFHRDEYAPDHTLRVGQLYFRDGTAAEAVAIIERRLKAFADQGHIAPDHVAKQLLADAQNQTGEWNAGWPISERKAA